MEVKAPEQEICDKLSRLLSTEDRDRRHVLVTSHPSNRDPSPRPPVFQVEIIPPLMRNIAHKANAKQRYSFRPQFSISSSALSSDRA